MERLCLHLTKSVAKHCQHLQLALDRGQGHEQAGRRVLGQEAVGDVERVESDGGGGQRVGICCGEAVSVQAERCEACGLVH